MQGETEINRKQGRTTFQSQIITRRNLCLVCQKQKFIFDKRLQASYVHLFMFSVEVCVYKGSVYNQGQSWRDACLYDCTCTDAEHGKYTCTDM